jgi:hypothetical protein
LNRICITALSTLAAKNEISSINLFAIAKVLPEGFAGVALVAAIVLFKRASL